MWLLVEMASAIFIFGTVAASPAYASPTEPRRSKSCAVLTKVSDDRPMPDELRQKLQQYFREPHWDFQKLKACLDRECSRDDLAKFVFITAADHTPGLPRNFARDLRAALALVWYGVKLIDLGLADQLKDWPDVLPTELATIRALITDLARALKARDSWDPAVEQTWQSLRQDLDRQTPR